MTINKYSDFETSAASPYRVTLHRPAPIARWSPRFRVFKFLFDKSVALLAMPFVLTVALGLVILNPFFNPGPLFFRQDRMGLGRKRFVMWKFRTMLPCETTVRHHADPLEEHRITPLGKFLRKSRVDELPNFFNVLKGDMSIIGPRPDAWSHAEEHIRSVPRYPVRFRVRPGITGLAQVRSGYADCRNSIRRKARYDHFYVTRSRIKMELDIIWRTVRVMLTGFGAK